MEIVLRPFAFEAWQDRTKREIYDAGFTAGAIQEAGNALKVLAILETANFRFLAFAQTKKEAKQLLKKRWLRHQQNTGATYTFNELQDSIEFVAITKGVK